MDEENEILETEKPTMDKPVKKKKVLTQAQLDALARGRAKGVEKLKQKGLMTAQVKETQKTIKKLKEDEKVETIEDLKKVNDLNYIRKTTEDMINKFNMIDTNIKNVENKFNSYLSEREERKRVKDANTVEKVIKQQLPKTMNDMMYREKIQKEQANNPFYGRI